MKSPFEALLTLIFAVFGSLCVVAAALGLVLLSPLWIIGKVFSGDDKYDKADKNRSDL